MSMDDWERELSPALVARLDDCLARLVAEKGTSQNANSCAFVLGLLTPFMVDAQGDSLWAVGGGDDNFGERVAGRPGGLTMANFLDEVEASYGQRGHKLIGAALNHPMFSERLKQLETQLG